MALDESDLALLKAISSDEKTHERLAEIKVAEKAVADREAHVAALLAQVHKEREQLEADALALARERDAFEKEKASFRDMDKALRDEKQRWEAVHRSGDADINKRGMEVSAREAAVEKREAEISAREDAAKAQHEVGVHAQLEYEARHQRLTDALARNVRR